MKKLLYSLTFGLFLFFVSCKKETSEMMQRQNASSVAQATIDPDFYIDKASSTPIQFLTESNGETETVIVASTYDKGIANTIDSFSITLRKGVRALVTSAEVAGDGQSFPVQFDNAKDTVGVAGLNFVNAPQIGIATHIKFKKIVDSSKSGKVFSFVSIGLKINGVWSYASDSTLTYKLVGSKPHVGLAPYNQSLKSDVLMPVFTFNLGNVGGSVLYDSLQGILNTQGATIDPNSFVLLDSNTSFTFGKVIAKTIITKSKPYGNYDTTIKIETVFIDAAQFPKGIVVADGSVHRVYLMAKVHKYTDSSTIILSPGDAYRMGWHDNTNRAFNGRTYLLNNGTGDYPSGFIVAN